MVSERIVLLFVHGGGFNKETWTPIVTRVQASTLLQRLECEIEAMDLPFHGEASDESTDAVLWFDGPKKNWPRVHHPAKRWPELMPVAIQERVQRIRQRDADGGTRTQIIVIAHSIGATSAMLMEMRHPGSIDGLIAFEPICNGAMVPDLCIVAANAMVANAIARQSEWEAWEEVVAYFQSTKAFRSWHPDALSGYLQGGIKRAEHGYRLAMPPIQEAALYSYDINLATFCMEDYARMQCPVIFEYGEKKTMLFSHEVLEDVARTYPTRIFISKPIKKTGHLMILEDPDTCAQRIIDALFKIATIQNITPPASRL